MATQDCWNYIIEHEGPVGSGFEDPRNLVEYASTNRWMNKRASEEHWMATFLAEMFIGDGERSLKRQIYPYV